MADDGSKKPEQEKAVLIQSVNRTTDLLSGRLPSTATIKAPSEEHMAVELVPRHYVTSMEALNSDAALEKGFLWVVLGALLGTITTVALSPNGFGGAEESTWVLLGAQAVAAVAFGFLSWRTDRKITTLKQKLHQITFDE